MNELKSLTPGSKTTELKTTIFLVLMYVFTFLASKFYSSGTSDPATIQVIASSATDLLMAVLAFFSVHGYNKGRVELKKTELSQGALNLQRDNVVSDFDSQPNEDDPLSIINRSCRD